MHLTEQGGLSKQRILLYMEAADFERKTASNDAVL